MRKIIYSLISIFLIFIITFIFFEFKPLEIEKSSPSVDSDNKLLNQTTESPSIGTVTGYFFFGYIDMRERLTGSEEEEYYYYMDRYFESHYNKSIKSVFNTNEISNIGEDYKNYFNDKGLDILSLPNKLIYADEILFQNGDYISIEIEGLIMESFPLQAKITKVEKISPRTLYR